MGRIDAGWTSGSAKFGVVSYSAGSPIAAAELNWVRCNILLALPTLWFALLYCVF